MHALQPNKRYKILTVKFAVPVSEEDTDDHVTDGFNEWFNGILTDYFETVHLNPDAAEEPIFADWSFPVSGQESPEHRTGDTVEEGEWIT